MQPNDLSYYRERAAAERKLAEVAGNSEAAAIHEELARQYEALIEQAYLRPRLLILGQGSPSERQVAPDRLPRRPPIEF